jgi:hypothetical protein
LYYRGNTGGRNVKFTVTQTSPSGFEAFAVSALDARQALDVVASMVERGATVVKIFDLKGLRYDLIDLESALEDEST